MSIRVDNRERRIASLEFVRLAGAPIGGSPMPKPLPLPFGSNRLLDACRTVLIVVAHESISAGKVTAIISIGGLLPGDFIVRAVITLDGKPVGSVVRTLRKVAR